MDKILNNTGTVLIDILLDNGYKKTVYEEQDNLVSYTKEIDILYFIVLTKKIDVVVCNKTLERIYNDYGTIVIVEYIPTQNKVQWCNSHRTGEQSSDYIEHETFDLSKSKDEYNDGMSLLQLFFGELPETTPYIKNGFLTRSQYLNSLVDEYDIPFNTILSLSNILGKTEDFDGLISALEFEQDRIETDFGYGE